MKLNMICIT